jgi:glyceraldehyde-3-phosphate dehydrogenase/erythrose-4-phosphate dehydrogenase
MATTIGLMGFGRIGRNLFRILYQSEDIKLAAISDIADHKALEYLLRFDPMRSVSRKAISMWSAARYPCSLKRSPAMFPGAIWEWTR